MPKMLMRHLPAHTPFDAYGCQLDLPIQNHETAQFLSHSNQVKPRGGPNLLLFVTKVCPSQNAHMCAISLHAQQLHREVLASILDA